MYYLVLHLSLTKCESHRRILTADFRTEIEIPTSTSIHKTYWLNTKKCTPVAEIYTFLCIHLKTFPSVFCTTAFRFRLPPGTQASMQTPVLGWRNLSILLCILCMPVQTVINPTSHRSYRSLGNIKHQSLSSNSLTLYIGLTVQCA